MVKTKACGKANKSTSKISGSHHAKAKKISRQRKPEEMVLEQWQIALRKQFAKEQNFQIKNIGTGPVFSEFMVKNPQTDGEYRVAIRGLRLGDNYCSCPDFAVNTLGTCKHIEFTLEKLQRKADGQKAFEDGFKPDYSEVYLRYGAKREVIFSPGVQCPKSILELAAKYFDKNGVLKPLGYSQFGTFMKKTGEIGHELRCYEDTMEFIAQVRDNDILKTRIEKAFPAGASSATFKKLLKVQLYPYQRQGALFAAKAGRSLIADDMGLGKTIQAIAAVEILAQTVGIERVLIICPTSLKHQWKQEIEKFSNRTAVVVEGMLAKRAALYGKESFYKIVNYEVIQRDLDRIRELAPDMIILDEAQRIKNWKTQRAQTVKKLESKYALVLTGTPLENRLEELHSIVEFVDRFHLGPLFRFLHEHQHVDEVSKVIGYRNLSKIAESLNPILIRRTKKEVLKELPERLDKNYFVPMTPQQKTHHDENGEIVAKIVAKWRRYGFLTETDQRRLMVALQNMRMSCNSTYLLDKKTDFGTKADELVSVLNEVFEQPDTKVVIFSQWIGTHEIIIERLKSSKHGHVFFHGGVPGTQRKDLIKQFKEDPSCRLFLSTDAGGVGLNLQNASVVINMDLPWNPAILEQRIGRIHRLGQHKPVRVVNFVAQGTIEHGMLSLLSFKQSLASGVLDKGKDEVFLGGSRLKQFMDSVDKATSVIPESMPQQTDGGENGSNADNEILAETVEKETVASPSSQQPWSDLISTSLSFFNKLGQTLLGDNDGKSSAKPMSEIFSGVKIETDKTTGQRHLRLPIPPKEILTGLAGILTELSKKM